MKFIVNTDGTRHFIEYVSDVTNEPLFYWEPERTPTIYEMIAYGEYTHTRMMFYSDYRRDHLVYPWT